MFFDKVLYDICYLIQHSILYFCLHHKYNEEQALSQRFFFFSKNLFYNLTNMISKSIFFILRIDKSFQNIHHLVSQKRFFSVSIINQQQNSKTQILVMKVHQQLTTKTHMNKISRRQSEQISDNQIKHVIDFENFHILTQSKIYQKLKKSNLLSNMRSQQGKKTTQRLYSPDLVERIDRLKKIEEFDKKIEQKLFKIRSQKIIKIKNHQNENDQVSQKTIKKQIKINKKSQSKNVQSQPTPTKQNQILETYYKSNQLQKKQIRTSQKQIPRIIKIKKRESLDPNPNHYLNQQQIFTQRFSSKRSKEYKFQILHAYQTRRKNSQDQDEISVNQDSYLIKRNLGESHDIHLFGVFDGHGKYGHHISNYLKVNLPNQILLKQSIQHDRQKLIKNSFNRMLVKLYETNEKQIETSGSTAICCMIEKLTLYVSNIGDSRAIMGFQASEGMCWQCKELSTDHVPSLEKQASRILQNGGLIRKATMGGQIQSGLRVWAKNSEGKSYGIRMTRSFGDSCLSSVGVTHIPQIKQYKLDERHKIIVIGSDGLYQKMSNYEIINFLAPYYQRKKSPQEAGQNLLKQIKKRMSIDDGYEDDITFIILFLNQC